MKVFISWSGLRSRHVAEALHRRLPFILRDVEPWFSKENISAGDRWSAALGEQLEACNFGILCITRENIESPWLHFEAGALAKSLSEGAVCPYVIDIDFAELKPPLSLFQAKKSDRESTFELVLSMNNRLNRPEPIERLRTLFEQFWRDFEQDLKLLPVGKKARPKRSHQEILITKIRDSLLHLNEQMQELKGSANGANAEPLISLKELMVSVLGRLKVADASQMPATPTVVKFVAPSHNANHNASALLVAVGSPIFNHRMGEIIVVERYTDSVVSDIASAMHLDTESFNAHWYIINPHDKATFAHLTWAEVPRIFAHRSRVLIVSSRPEFEQEVLSLK